MMEHMTAKVSCFARAYHARTSPCPVFADTAAEALLGPEYEQIARHMTAGARFFFPDFQGTPEEALRQVADRRLSPPVLGRSAYCETKLAQCPDCRQYLLFAAGYDTFGIRNAGSGLSVFELDRPALLADKREKMAAAGLESCAAAVPCDLADDTWRASLEKAGCAPGERVFASLLGISYYLSRADFRRLLARIGGMTAAGSALCLDYPEAAPGQAALAARALAHAAGETMQDPYAPGEMEALLAETGFHVRERLGPREMTERFFSAHNRRAPDHPLHAPEGVGYLFAVRAGGV